jgi:hypothetical protein
MSRKIHGRPCAARPTITASQPVRRSTSAAFRHVVNRAEDAATQLRLTRDYFDALDAGVTLAA